MKHTSQPWPLWVGLLAFIAMLAAVYGLLSQPKAKQQPLAQLQPTLTATFAASATPAPSPTPQPQSTATEMLLELPTLFRTMVATSLPLADATPQPDAQAYRLKPWTEQDALQAYQEARDTANNLDQQEWNQVLSTPSLTSTPVETYSSSDQAFYEESLLYEAFLRYPQLRADTGLNNELLDLKLNGVPVDYAYVHNHSVQPLADLIETDLNQGQVQFSADALNTWLGLRQMSVRNQSALVKNLFGDGSTAQVVQISANGPVLAMFAIRHSQSGAYSVIPLYPEYRNFNWGQETFQVLDLNGDGRAEIAISDDQEGIGISHFCEKTVEVYEWNGSAFQDLMENNPVESADLDGACVDPTFIPGQNGAMVIVTETQLPNDCDNQFYTVRTLYYWDGQGFKGAAPQSLPAPDSRSDMCAISWAITAGPQNSQAAQILASAFYPWPKDAVKEWGPASRDYFSLKLATWYIRLGQLNQGLALLHSVASAPYTPAYPLPAQVANTFLNAYAYGGMYRALQAVDDFYLQEFVSSGTCSWIYCDIDQTRSLWGFAENTWDNGFRNDFDAIDGMRLSLQVDQPKNLDEFTSWLKNNQIQYRDLQQADLDDDGTPDWLVAITFTTKEYDGSIDQENKLYTFLSTDTGIIPFDIHYLPDGSNFKIRWQSYLPAAGAEEINVFQADQFLFTFRFHKSNGEYSVVQDLPTDMLTDVGNFQVVSDWNITDTPQGKVLVVQYGGVTGTYVWDSAQGKLVPTGFSPDLQEQYISQIEQALYVDNDPSKALPLLDKLLAQKTIENYVYEEGVGIINPPRLRPYLLYLRGLAYELSADAKDAVSDYWQLWHDYPADPFAVIAQRKLEPNK